MTKVYTMDTNTYNNINKIYCDESSIYNISLARWKRKRKYHIWSKQGKLSGNNIIYYCVPASLTALGVFRTPQEVMIYLNKVVRKVQERGTTMPTTIIDKDTMWCPRVVHIAVTAMEWTLRKLHNLPGEQHFKIEN